MAEAPGKKKRRPVDALFGEEEASPLPSYVVEAPRPATTVSPPPPAPVRPRPRGASEISPTPTPSSSGDNLPPTVPAFASALATEAPPAVVPPPIKVPAPIRLPQEASIEPPVIPPAKTATPAPGAPLPPAPSPVVMNAALYPSSSATSPYSAGFALDPAAGSPAIVPNTAAGPLANVPEETKHYFAFMPDTIRQLYTEVNDRLSDSPTIGDYCMKMLMLAREAYIKQDYATAEYYIETVDAKLHRSAISMQASRSPKVLLLYFWEFFMLFVSATLIAITYVANLTLFGLPVAPEFAILLRAIGWGGVGGVIGALYNLPWFIQFREYDPAYNMNYFVRPLQGFLIGGVLFLLSQAGVLAGTTVIGLTAAPGQVPLGPVFLYVLAALAGFKQEYVWEFFDNILKAIFRIPQLPTELNVPEPPAGAQVAKKR